jgi:hypothetical protein
LRTVEWIDAHYPGCDIQERIRNFIIDAYTSWGAGWVLLGGDEDNVPVRWTQPYQNEPSDLYYADLEGNWNNNQNAYFGDSIGDLAADSTFVADVALGRLPAWDAAQVASFWDKLEAYEKGPDTDPDYIHGILMAGGSFDARTDDSGRVHADGWGAGCKDQYSSLFDIDGLQSKDWFGSCGFGDPHELYAPIIDPDSSHKPRWWEGDDSLTNASFSVAFENGYQFVNHIDHGSSSTLGTGVKTGGGWFTKAQAASLRNGVNHSSPRYSILYSIGCSTGALDHASIGQTLMNNPEGGCIAYVGCSRPGDAYGQPEQDQHFYYGLFVKDLTDVGSAFKFSQPEYRIRGECRYTYAKMVNLFGDPAMPVWTDGPDSFGLAHVTEIPLGPQNEDTFGVSVTKSDNSPVRGALVTLLMRDDSGHVALYAWDTTDVEGKAEFPDLCPESPDSVFITVTKQNFLPREGVCVVQPSDSAYMHFAAIGLIDDDDTTGASSGNGDSIVNPGEHVELTIRLENTGGDTADSVLGVITTLDTRVGVVPDTVLFGDIGPGVTDSSETPFVFSVLPAWPDDTCDNPCESSSEITFTISMMTEHDTWSDDFRVMVLRDSLVPGERRVTEVASGAFIMDSLAVTNYGWGAADSVTAVLTSNNTGYVVDDSLAAFDEDILGQSTAVSVDSFLFHDSLQDTSAASFTLTLTDRYGRIWTQQIDLVPPDAPGTPWLLLGGDHYLTIGWPKSESSDLRGYNVYRRHDTTSGTWHLANSMLVDSSATFRDQGLSPYTEYHYKVTAVDFSGNESPASESLTTRTTPTYQVGWPVHTASGNGQRTSGVCGNIIGDDKLEVVAVMGDSIYAWSCDGQLLSGWPKGLGITSWSNPALGDLDGEGLDEVVLGLNDGQWLCAWDGDGNNAPGDWPLNVPFTGSVTIADVNQDGSLEVVGATADGRMNIWSSSGALISNWTIHGSELNYRVHGSCAVADLYPDSAGLEIVVIAKDTVIATPLSCGVFCYSSNGGAALWAAGIPATPSWGSDRNSPVIADLNRDGDLEIVASVSGGDAGDVWILDRDGNKLDSLGEINAGIDSVKAYYGAPWACPAIGDINADSVPEIVLTLGAGSSGVYDCRTCLAAWGYNEGDTWSLLDSVELNASFWQSGLAFGTGPTIADINGDGAPEILAGFWDGWRLDDRLRAFKYEGSELKEVLTDGFPVFGVDMPEQDLVVTDLDLDGDLELLAFMSQQGVVHTWDFPVSGDRRNVEWSGFHGDVRHTGLYAQPVHGVVDEDVYWWGRYQLRGGNLTVNDSDLVVPPGTWLQAFRGGAADAGIVVNGGEFTARGTRSAPTWFEAEFAGDVWDGIRVTDGRASVTGCHIADATEGLALTNCDTLIATHDTFTDYQVGGITSESTAVSSIDSCRFTGAANAVYGVYANGLQTSPCSIANNTFLNSGDYDVWVEASLAPDIAGNRLQATGAGTLYGIKCYEIATTPQLRGSIRGNTISGHGQGGILVQASSPRIYSRNDISDNNSFGLDCRDGSYPVVESTDITGQSIGVNAWNGSYPDLGTFQGSFPSGYNSIDTNCTYYVVNANDLPAQTIKAQLNWWGQAPPDTTKFYGSVDYTRWLVEPPGDGPQEKSVAAAFPLALGLGRPNPFSSATHIMLSNPRQQRLAVSIYDVAGRHVQTLFNAEAPPGRSWLSWNGLDTKGRRVGSGVYFCRLTAESDKKVSRVVYVRGK